MTDFATSRRYRPDPSRVEQPQSWGRGCARASLTWDAIVITVSGEIDATNATQLAAYVESRGTVASRLYLDLRNVDFIGACGLAALRRLEHQFEISGTPWRLLAGPAVRKLLRVCRATDLPQIETLDHVLGRPRVGAAESLACN